MKIPFFSSKKNDEKIFLGLFLKELSGTVLLIKKTNNRLIILDKEKFNYRNGWENLIEDVDDVLYQLEQRHKLNQEEINEVIFFLFSHLVDEKNRNIKQPYLDKIKNLLKNLELKPLGYIECYEAVYSYYKKQEEVFSSILLELDKENMSLFVYQANDKIFEKKLSRTDDIIADFNYGLSSLSSSIVLPSKIIIYDSESIDDIAEKFISYSWPEKIFVQIPKITLLKEDILIENLIKVFEEQIITKEKESFYLEKEKEEKENQFGFFINQDIKIKEKEDNQKTKFSLPKLPTFNLSFLKFNLPKFSFSLDFFKRPSLILSLIFLIFSFFLINEYFFHKAQITVYLPYQKTQKLVKKDLPVKIASFSSQLKAKKTTTGKKEVGEKARGEVTIHNFTDEEKTFDKGVVLIANNLRFLLDSQVKVASSTITADGSAKLPGKIKVGITAENIGPEYNLSSNNKFIFENLPSSSFFALNNNSLSGGTKRKIPVVSSSDLKDLDNEIISQGKKEKKLPQLKENEEIIDTLTEVKILEKNYSKEVGEEAEEVELSAKVNYLYFVFDKKNLLAFLKDDLLSSKKNNFVLEEKNIVYEIIKAEKNKDKVDLVLDVSAKFFPQINKENLKKELIFKNIDQINRLLKEKYQIKNLDINNQSFIGFFNQRLPLFKKNIKLNFSSL